MEDADIVFDERGLVPCVVQDWATGEVLTLAYMNAEALARTRETGELHLWSRSRDELWHKGATSGQHAGGEGDPRTTATATRCSRWSSPPARPATPARAPASSSGDLEPPAPHEALPGLERTIAARAAERPDGSYTAELLANPAHVGEKVQEEAEEVARAAREESDERVAEEAADVLYHLAVLLRSRGLSLADAGEALLARRRWRSHATTWSPSAQTFIEDTETPVSAFLKLRGAGPAFLLESAEQGQRVGRWSFIGYKPRRVLRWSLGDGGDPYALAAAEISRHRQAPAPEPAAVRRRRRRLLRLRLRAHGRAAAGAEPGPDRPAGHGADAVRRDRRLRPPQAHGHDPRQRLRRRGRRARGGVRARPRGDRRGPRAARRPAARSTPAASGPSRCSSRTCRARRSRRWSPGSSSTCTPATPSRSSRRSAGRRPRRSSRSRSTAACARSTRRRTCTSSTSRTSSSSAPRPSRWSPSPAATSRRARSPARARAAPRSRRTRRSPRSCSPTRRSAPST